MNIYESKVIDCCDTRGERVWDKDDEKSPMEGQSPVMY
jgi:hypothetical protein